LSVPTFFHDATLAPGASVALAESAAHHARVRRLESGETVTLVDGRGARASGEIESLSRRDVTVRVHDVAEVEPPPAVHLLVPISDRERMLWLAEKATELALASWRPVLWRRSRSVTPRGEGEAFAAKARARMIAALEQSGGAWLPVIHDDATPEATIADAPRGERVVLDGAGAPILASRLSSPLTIALGPEGGFEPDELDALRAAGFRAVSLAPNILRFETAALAALAVARAALTPMESPDGR
jgi:16S rRNA (uracil1498-N3)-methyltransferase